MDLLKYIPYVDGLVSSDSLVRSPVYQLPLLFTCGVFCWAYFFGVRKRSLKGKVALVTGGASGIGRLMVKNFAAKGCTTVIFDLSQDALDKVRAEVEADGHTCYTYVCDVSRREVVYSVAEKVKKDVGRIDIIVNNAGIVYGKYFFDLDDDAIERTMKVNSHAHFWMHKAFLPDMIERDSGHIVTICSTMGLFGAPGLTDYVASKFAANGIHECIRLELRRLKANGVYTTLVCPWMFDGLEARFQWLVPYLKEQDVARRTVECCETGQQLLIMPFSMNFIPFIMRWMPVPLYDFTMGMFGTFGAMENFRGGEQRKKKSQ